MFKYIKKYASLFIGFLMAVGVVILFVLSYLYLKQRGKKLQIHPEFKIIDAYTEDTSDLETAINEAKELLKGYK